MAQNELAIELREETGKGVARKLRAAGRIPGVFYGRGEPRSISMDPRVLERLLATSAAGINTIIDLRGGGLEGSQAIVKELQRDPVRGAMLHADLFAIDLARKIQVSVPVHLAGTAVGVQLGGGIIDHALREIELECLPRAIPEEIVADVSALDVGMTLHVRDLPLPEGVELLSDADLSVVSVALPAAVEEAAPEGEEVAEGEVPAEGEAAEARPEEGEAKESE